MRGISDAQQSSVIAVVAKIPVAEARKPFLIELEKQLPKAGKVSDETLLACINSALKSFKPGQWQGDVQGAFPPITEDLPLKEAALLYERVIHGRGAWSWPPFPPISPETAKAKEAAFALLTPEQKAERYHRSLFNSDAEYEAAKAAEEKRRQAEETANATPWPLPAPPTTRTIRGEIEPEAEEPEQPIVPLSERAQPKQLSIYGRHLAWLRGELPENLSDEERAEALNEKLAQERRERRRLQGAPKAFF
jgi:hypothetical protein